VKSRALLAYGVGAVLGAAALAAYVGAAGCGPDAPPAAPQDARPPPAPVDAAVRPADADPPDTAVPDPTPPRPAFVPQGWELWADYRKACNIYLPTRAEVLPPPARWKPCRPDYYEGAETAVPACEEWDLVEPGQTEVGVISAYTQATLGVAGGRLLVHQFRRFPNYVTWVLLDALTGSVVNSILMADKDCYAYPASPSATASAYRASKASEAGRDDAKYGFLIAPNDPSAKTYGGPLTLRSSVAVGDTLAAETATGNVLWQGPFSNHRATALVREPDGLQPLLSFYRGDTAYIESYEGDRYVWRVARPGLPIDTWFDNGQTPMGDHFLATDDVDVAWIHKERCSGSNCAVASLFVAKHPSAGARPVARRLHADVPNGGHRLALGCGYVAARAAYADYRTQLRVTRISDGVSFLRRNEADPRWNYIQPLGVTCDHVYFIRNDPGVKYNVVRFRLDALGPPIPPE